MVWMVLPGAIMFQIKPETRGEPLLFTISAPGSFTGHMDVLWPIRMTQQKLLRVYTSVTTGTQTRTGLGRL